MKNYYDEAIKYSEPPLSIKEKFYSDYIKPYLKEEPGLQYSYLIEQSWNAWRLKIKKNDIKKMLFVEWLCEELAKDSESDLAVIISNLLQETHDVALKSEIAERNAYNSETSGDIEGTLSDHIRQYKVFFEGEFRLWATIPYYYVCKKYGVKNQGSDPESYVYIGSSEKFHALKNIKTSLLKGNRRDLIDGFDNDIRNSGEGHDLWEITDKQTILFKIIDPKTGKFKKDQKRELSKNDLENLIMKCRKTIWILKNGLVLFLINNPNFALKIQRNKEFKIKEIKNYLTEFAKERQLALVTFLIAEDRKNIQLGLKHDPTIIKENSQVFFGKAEKYDLIGVEIKVKYRDQILGVMQYLLTICFEEGDIPNINLQIFDQKNELIGDLEYRSTELEKLFSESIEENVPLPSKGKMPTEEYLMTSEIKVPFGQRKACEALVKQLKGFEGALIL